MKLVIHTEETLEKARSQLIFRTDLPFRLPNGGIGYRKGWVKPEDSKKIDKLKEKGGKAKEALDIKHEEDMFDQGEGESWGQDEEPVKQAEIKPTEPVPEPEPAPIVAQEAPEAESKAPLYMEELSEKALIIRGDTRTHKDEIKATGARWNRTHGGWIIPKSWESKVRGKLGKLLEPSGSQTIDAPVQEPIVPVEKPQETPRIDITTTPEYIKLKKSTLSDMATILGIDTGKLNGYDRALFVSAITGKIKRVHANGNQAIVDAILDYIKDTQARPEFKKPAITQANGIWKLHSQWGKAPEEKKTEPIEPVKPVESDGLPDPQGHHVGETITKDGVAYQLNANHRWERIDQAKEPNITIPATLRVGETIADNNGVIYRLNANRRLERLEGDDGVSPALLQFAREVYDTDYKGFAEMFKTPEAQAGLWQKYTEWNNKRKSETSNQLGQESDPKTIEDLKKQYRDTKQVHKLYPLMDYYDASVESLKRLRDNPRISDMSREVVEDLLKIKGVPEQAPEEVKAEEEVKAVEPEPVPESTNENQNGTPVNLTLDPDLRGQHDLEVPIAKTRFRNYGSWSANGKHVSAKERAKLNADIETILKKPRNTLTQEDVDQVRRYSGFGGVDVGGERGALYDYFTSPPVAKMVWQVLNKITPVKAGAKVLEPSCGGGVFFDVAPDNLELHGVEYDNRTAAVASITQDRAKINPGSFEQFNLHNEEKFDHIIGNAPFGDRSVQTSFMDMPKEGSLDRYFMHRSLDNLADGGSMAMIVAPGVLTNKGNRDWRVEMLKQGQFMGAIKLPDTSFKHTHTGVSPDVLIFRKYPEEVRNRLAQLEENGMKEAGFWNDGWVEGSYFTQEEGKGHIIGEAATGNWGRLMASGETSPEALDAMVKNFKSHEELNEDHLEKLRSMTKDSEPTKKSEKEIRMTKPESMAFAAKILAVGATKTVDGQLYRLNENHRWERIDGNTETAQKIDHVKAIAKAVKDIRDAMQNGEPADDLQAMARELIESYREKYGVDHHTDKDIKRFLNENAKVAGIHEAMATTMESEILTNTNIYDKEINEVDGHNPAVKALYEMGKRMANGTEENIRAYFPGEAEGILEEAMKHQDIFLTPEGEWQLKEDFLTGNAWKKIDSMKQAEAAETDPAKKAKLQHGIESLTKAIGWVPIEDADFIPQSTWVPLDLINAWVQDENGMNQKGTALFINEDGKWENKRSGQTYEGRSTGWNPRTVQLPYDVDNNIMYFMNGHKQKSSYNNTEDYNETTNTNFTNWVMNNPEARARMEELYNRNFNTELAGPTKTYSIELDGWNPEVVLGAHQWQTIHHMYRQGKGISALGTGFGKTKAGIALMALLRQEGKAKRFYLQVPNNKVKDWVDEILGRPEIRGIDPKTGIEKVMQKRKPGCMKGLKVGYVDPAMDGFNNQATRYKKYQELANGDYDVIIMPETSGTEIQLTAERDKWITDNIIADQLMDGKKRTVRQHETVVNTIQTQLEASKKNKTIAFEDFGCDAIMVDEFHRMKNLFSTSLSRETGLNDGRRSERALSMFKKMEYMRGQHKGKNVFGLTATPLTNSPLEYYNMMQHIAPEELKSMGINNINNFITNFAIIKEDSEKYDPFSGQVKNGKKLESFRNIRSLQDMFFKYTDLQNDSEKIGLKKPKANTHPNVIPKNDEQVSAMKEIRAEMEAWQKENKSEKEEGDTRNYLTYYSKFRTASLDLELYDPVKYRGWKNPKVDEMAKNAWDLFKSTGSGNVVFCDRILSGDASFNMHEKLKNQLIAQGFKSDEIIIINGLTKTGAKMSDSALEKDTYEAIQAYNNGKYKVIIGTTSTIGEGVNLQANSAGLHHVDIPFRPSDLVQRNGRIDRQGNEQAHVALHTYATAGTTDNYAMSLVMNKENWINQLLKTKSNVFTNPDEGGIDPAELLLYLTEEWGDKDKATELRAKLIADRQAAVKKENTESMKKSLEMLSRARGALRGYDGDKGNMQYQNRLRNIASLTRTLARNPEFKHLDLLSDNPPDFIYSKKYEDVYKAGDLIVDKNGVHRITKIDHKKMRFVAEHVDGDVEDYAGANVKNRKVKTIEWDSANGYGKWGYDSSKIVHVPNPSEHDLKKYRMLTKGASFHEGTREEKASLYQDAMSHDLKNLPYFDMSEDGRTLNMGITGSYKGSQFSRLINPYTDEGEKQLGDILTGKVNVGMTGYASKQALETALGENHPIVVGEKRREFNNKRGAADWNKNTHGIDRVRVDDYAQKHGDGNYYGVVTMLESSPDWELVRGGDSYRDMVAVRKVPMQKALVIPVELKQKKLAILVGRR